MSERVVGGWGSLERSPESGSPVGSMFRGSGGRIFTLVGHESYVNRDGENIRLEVWEAECLNCGSPFSARTLESARIENKNFRLVRCPLCQKAFDAGRKTRSRFRIRSRGGRAWT